MPQEAGLCSSALERTFKETCNCLECGQEDFLWSFFQTSGVDRVRDLGLGFTGKEIKPHESQPFFLPEK